MVGIWYTKIGLTAIKGGGGGAGCAIAGRRCQEMSSRQNERPKSLLHKIHGLRGRKFRGLPPSEASALPPPSSRAGMQKFTLPRAPFFAATFCISVFVAHRSEETVGARGLRHAVAVHAKVCRMRTTPAHLAPLVVTQKSIERSEIHLAVELQLLRTTHALRFGSIKKAANSPCRLRSPG